MNNTNITVSRNTISDDLAMLHDCDFQIEVIHSTLTLLPRQSAVRMRRHIYAADRMKSDNERRYYIVDAINEAIEAKRKISFRYTDYDIHKNRILTNDGNPYTVTIKVQCRRVSGLQIT